MLELLGTSHIFCVATNSGASTRQGTPARPPQRRAVVRESFRIGAAEVTFDPIGRSGVCGR